MAVRRHGNMDNKMTTKEIFLIEALKVFAEDGYDNASIAKIAKNVGCSAPALYKHYPNKQALFDGVIAMSDAGYAKHMNSFVIPHGEGEDFKRSMTSVSEDSLVKIMDTIFDHLLNDEYPSLFRKILIAEQFRNPKLAAIYNERYVELPIKQYAQLFTMLQQEGKLDNSYDVEVLAAQYVLPTAVYVSMCDREHEKEEWAREQLEKHVRQFVRTYMK